MQLKLPMVKRLEILRLKQGRGFLDWCALGRGPSMRVEVRNFKAFPLTWVSHGFNLQVNQPPQIGD